MKASTFLLFALIGLTAISNHVCDAVAEMTCKEFVGSLTKRQIGGIQACNKKLGLKSAKEKKERMNCVLRCVMENERLLNAEGLFDDVNFQKFLEAEMPPNLLVRGEPLFKHCKETTASKLDPTETNCKSYDVLIKCFLGAIGELCKE